MIKEKSGNIELSILLILTSILLIKLFWQNEILSLYQDQLMQRHQYLQKDFKLQQVFQQLSTVCPLKETKAEKNGIAKVSLQSSEAIYEENQWVWCVENRLFIKSIRSALVENVKLTDYLQESAIKDFQPHFKSNKQLNPTTESYLYWFDEANTEIELNGDVSGIIIARGNLHIIGKGNFRGGVLIVGQLKLAENIKISYKRSVVDSVEKQFQHWRVAEKSWHDFYEVFK